MLTRATYLALVLVPILAGTWPAVRGAVNWVNHDIRKAADAFHAAAERTEVLRAYLPDDAVLKREIERGSTAVAELEHKLADTTLATPRFPASLALVFFGAFFVALGHFVFQMGAGEHVVGMSRDVFVAQRNREFRECDERKKRDLLFRAFPPIARIAKLIPGARHLNLVRRNDKTIWIPSSLEQLSQVGKVEEPDEKGPAEGTDADEDGSHDETSAPAKASAPASTARLPFTREELELIVIDEGAKAEYDVLARQGMGWAKLSGSLYLVAVVLIAWLVTSQAEEILHQAGATWFPRVLSGACKLALAIVGVGYAAQGLGWCARSFRTRLRKRGRATASQDL